MSGGSHISHDILDKTPDEDRVYTVDFSGRLPPGDALQSVVSAVRDEITPSDADDIAIGDAPAIVATDFVWQGYEIEANRAVNIEVSGGQSGARYGVLVTVTTTGGETLQGKVFIDVVEA